MQKRILSMLLCLCLLVGLCALPVSASEANTDIYEGTSTADMNHGVLLYTGYNGYSGKKFTSITDDGVDALLNATDEVLLIPIMVYNRYIDADGVEHQIITENVINNMTSDMINYPSYLSSVKTQYLETAKNVIKANYYMEDYAADAAATTKRLVEANPDVKVWLSVTSCEGFHALTHLFAPAWIDLVDDLKKAVGEEIWNKNIMGIYYATEDIVTYQYTKFDSTAVANDFNSPIVYAMHKVSDAVHAYGKKMLWIPYYHASNTVTSPNVGYVANLTNIFDTVILQPSYYFNADHYNNLSVISKSVEKQAIVNSSGAIVGGQKTSNTAIGFEMEISDDYFTDSACKARYDAYVSTFSKYVGKYPTAFYASSPDVMTGLTSVIGDFFDVNNKAETTEKAVDYYSIPVEDIGQWETWESDSALENSQYLDAQVTSDGLKIGFNTNAVNTSQSFHIRNSSGMVRVHEGDKIVVDIETNGEASLTDILWKVRLYFIVTDFSLYLGKYIGEAAGIPANAYDQLPRGRYQVELDLAEILKDYDKANGLSGTDSAYEKIFGASGDNFLCGIYFTMYSRDAEGELTIRELSLAREMEVYKTPAYADIIADTENGAYMATAYTFPVGNISAWVAERTANHASGYKWTAPLTGTEKSDTINGAVTSDGAMRLTLSGTVQCPIARIENVSGLATVSKDDYLNIDVVMEGDETNPVRWGVYVVLNGTSISFSKYIAQVVGKTVNAYNQIGSGKYKVSVKLGDVIKAYDADNGTSYYSSFFESTGKATMTSLWMCMYCNTPANYTDLVLILNSASITSQPYYVEYEHSYTAVVTAPTCTQDGYTTYTCRYCDDSYVADTVTATGHSYGEWYTVTEPTATAEDEERRDCTCGDYETRAIPVISVVESSVSHEIINGKLIITVVTESRINRVALYGADGKCIKTFNDYAVGDNGAYVWTIKMDAPTEETIYAVKGRDAATSSYKNGIIFPEFTVVPEVVFESVEVDVRGDKVYVIATTVSENYDRVAVVNPVDNSYVKYTRNYNIVDGKYVWTIFFDYVEGMDKLIVKARDIRTNHYNNAQAVEVTVEAFVEPVIDVTVTDYDEDNILVTVTTIPDLYRVKVAFADAPTSCIAYARSAATKADDAWTWEIVIARPTETSEYAVDIAYTKASYARYFNYVTYEV